MSQANNSRGRNDESTAMFYSIQENKLQKTVKVSRFYMKSTLGPKSEYETVGVLHNISRFR